MLRNIIWDVDGTLFDTYPVMARAFKAALGDVGKDASLEWIEGLARNSLGYCFDTLVAKYRLNEEEFDQAFVNYYGRAKPEEQPVFPGIKKICEYICNIGGKNVIVTHRRRSSTEELLAANELSPYFSGSVAADDGFPKKPDPAAFEAIIKQQSLNREETITVGDRNIDILAGQAVGVFSCLFGSETGEVKPDLTISNFDELYQYILSRNG